MHSDAGLSVSGGWTSLVTGIAHERSGWVPFFGDTIAETVGIGAPQWPGGRWHLGKGGQAWAARSFMCWREGVQSSALLGDGIQDSWRM